MAPEILTPGMEDGDHPDRGPEMFRGLGQFGERLGGGAEKQIVEDLLVHKNQGIKFGGEGKDHMEVFNGQEVFPSSLDPLFFP